MAAATAHIHNRDNTPVTTATVAREAMTAALGSPYTDTITHIEDGLFGVVLPAAETVELLMTGFWGYEDLFVVEIELPEDADDRIELENELDEDEDNS